MPPIVPFSRSPPASRETPAGVPVVISVPGFSVAAWSRDGVIEAVERPGKHFVLGVQWHPEILAEKIPALLALFQALVQASAAR